MAQAVHEGADAVEDTDVRLRRIPELLGARKAMGRQETTILTSLVPLLHLGMIFVGLPYGDNPQILTTDGIGGSPYGPATLAGGDGSRQPVDRELGSARNLGRLVANVSARLKGL